MYAIEAVKEEITVDFLFGCPGQEDDVLDFANYVFSMVRRPIDFKRLLPKVYARRDFAPLHALAMENGRIKGTLALLPDTLRVGEKDALRTGYLGTMAVHPYARGGGIMRTLMAMAVKRGEEIGLDMLALDGRRHRYNYFGFERGGAALRFTMNADCLKHGFADVDAGAIELTPLNQEGEDGLGTARRAQRLLSVAGERRDLLPVLQSWQATPQLVRVAGRPAGYLCVQNGAVTETALPETAVLPALKKLLEQEDGGEISVLAYPYDGKRLEALRRVSENYAVSDGLMLRVLNWSKVLSTLLNFRRSFADVEDGSVVLDIEGAGRLRLSVAGSRVWAEPAGEAPQAVWSHNEAVTRLFSPLAMMLEGPVPLSWLPLPIAIPRPDAF